MKMDQLINRFSKLPKKEQISILHSALDIMGQCNYKRNKECIIMAMGYEQKAEEPLTWIKNEKSN